MAISILELSSSLHNCPPNRLNNTPGGHSNPSPVPLTSQLTPTAVGHSYILGLSPVSIQTQSLALRALRKRKPQETQALALASSQSWFPLLRPSIPIGWLLRLLRENFAVFVYATHATQAIAFGWKPGLTPVQSLGPRNWPQLSSDNSNTVSFNIEMSRYQ